MRDKTMVEKAAPFLTTNPGTALAAGLIGASYLASQAGNLGPPIQNLNQLVPLGGGQFVPVGQQVLPPERSSLENQEQIANANPGRRSEFPTHNSRGELIPVVSINLLPEEEKKDESQSESQPVIFQPPMGGPRPEWAPPPAQDQIPEPQPMIMYQREAQEIERDAPVRQEDRDYYLDHLRIFIAYAQQLGITWENTKKAAAIIRDHYYLSVEKKMKQIEETIADNQQRQEFFEQNDLPPQCKRRVYLDGSGTLRSVVICESLGAESRIYRDR